MPKCYSISVHSVSVALGQTENVSRLCELSKYFLIHFQQVAFFFSLPMYQHHTQIENVYPSSFSQADCFSAAFSHHLPTISCSLTQLLLFQVPPKDYIHFHNHSYCILHACNVTPSVPGNRFSIHDCSVVSSTLFNNIRLSLLVPFTFSKDTDPVPKPFGNYICTINISWPLSFLLEL